MNTRVKTEALVKHAMKMLDSEIDQHNKGQGTVGSIRQLVTIKEVLCNMLSENNSDENKIDIGRIRGMGHMIVDSWPLDSELGTAILDAEHAFRDR